MSGRPSRAIREVTREDNIQLTHEFLRKIDRSDAIYVIDADGDTGRSVCIEIGYASALGKTVLLSRSPRRRPYALASGLIAVPDAANQIRP